MAARRIWHSGTLLPLLIGPFLIGSVALAPGSASAGAPARSVAGPAVGTSVIGFSTSGGVFEVAPDGTGLRQVPGTDGSSAGPVWSPDGNVVAFTQAATPADTSSKTDLQTLVVDGSCRTAFPNPGGGAYSAPTWSPDGSHLAFVYDPAGAADPTAPGRHVARSDGTDAGNVDGGSVPAAWAPDGSGRLALSGPAGLAVYDTNAATEHILDHAADTEFPTWSPDGQRIAYNISTQLGLWVIGADGKNRVNITTGEDFFPAWSPDGSRIAYNHADGTGALDVWVVNADGTGARAITTSGQEAADGPLWSPDGSILAYNHKRASAPFNDVWAVNADGLNDHLVAPSARLGGFFERKLPIGQAGYRLVDRTGVVRGFGTHCSLGPAPARLSRPIVGTASTPDGLGYWLAGAGGAVFSFGEAAFHGSWAGRPLAAPVVGMAATPDGGGYWLVAADGGVLTFGDAGFHGSMAGRRLNAPVVGMAPTADGRGYWLVGADGGVYSFGDAQFEGSAYTPTPTGPPLHGHLRTPIVGLVPTADGHGYWLAAAGGGVFTYGRAPYIGSLGGIVLAAPVVSVTGTPDRGGFWLVAADGGVFSFGDAPFRGSGVGVSTSTAGLAP